MEYVSRIGMQHLKTNKCGIVLNVMLTLDNVTVTSTAAKFGGQSVNFCHLCRKSNCRVFVNNEQLHALAFS